MAKEYDEVWAVESKLIESFFAAYQGDISVIPLPDKPLGSISLPQTRVIIKGEKAEEIYRDFFLHFLKAGG